VLAVLALAGAACSDSSGDLDAWCSAVERAAAALAEVDFDAVRAGDPEQIEAGNRAEQASIELRDTEPPAEVRDAFEKAFDPRGFEPDASPEYADARDEFGRFALENCDFPAELEELITATTP
jgi:hypothetical protein